jgi:hypothetical protein
VGPINLNLFTEEALSGYSDTLLDPCFSYKPIAGDIYLECDDPGSLDEINIRSTCQQQISDKTDPLDSEEQGHISQMPESYIEEKINLTSSLESDLEYTTEKLALQFRFLTGGSNAQRHNSKPKQACLYAESVQPIPSQKSFDIDSIIGFVNSPIIAIYGIQFYSIPQFRQNVQNSVHITTNEIASDLITS